MANDAFKGWLKGVPGRLLFACGGERRFLDRYAADLHARHHEVPIPFAVPSGPDVKISVSAVYVPLRAAEGISSRGPAGTEVLGWEAVDALLAAGKKVIVCGDPGAGKSMYLRRAVLGWAEASSAGTRPERVPVLLELHELKPDALKPGGIDVVALLAQHFASPAGRNVPERWIEKQLLAGRVTLYLDGLDEVPAADRRDLVRWINDVGRNYPKAGMIVTCRTAVYPAHREHLKETVDRSLAIQEFTDLHIHRFLRGWRWPPRTPPDSVDRLLKALTEVPRLMSLARNPLLLTAIAYLYSYVYPHTDKELPRTRAEFYQQVSDAFVEDRGRPGEFGSELKRAVLCHAGLKAQDALAESGGRRGADEGVGREFPGGVLLDWVAQTLEKQHELPDRARSVIDEICVRSGLLSRIENGRYYQFAHISLQEYLAAEALAGDWDALLTRYDADPERWRETVRLWCGVTRHDCSPMIRDLRARDLLLSFQCLAEARYVEGELVREMVIDAGERLGSGDMGDASGTALEAALGVAATGPAAMSDAVFALLEPLAGVPATPGPTRGAAIRALAATGSPGAAQFLAALLDRYEAARAALASMGDVAVPVLRGAAMERNRLAVELLGAVGTGRAAVALADVMIAELALDVGASLSRRCAVLLGGLIAEPEVEQAVREWARQPSWAGPRESSLTGDPGVWFPFAEDADDPIIPVMGLVIRLVGNAFEAGELPTEAGLDARPAAVLLLHAAAGAVGGELQPPVPEHLDEVSERMHFPTDRRDRTRAYFLGLAVIEMVVPVRGAPPEEESLSALYQLCRQAWARTGHRAEGVLHLLDRLPVRERLLVLGLRWHRLYVRPQVWETCADPPQDTDYDVNKSWHYRLALALLVATSVVAGVSAVRAAVSVAPWGPPWLGWVALGALGFGWSILLASGARSDLEEGRLATLPFAVIVPTGPEDLLSLISSLVFLPATAVYAFVAWADWWGTTTAVALSGALPAVCAAALLRGLARKRRADQGKDIARQVAHEVVTALRRPPATAPE
ncbi:NACHT domain-containing protein [Streptomyces sp. NPDC050658]|uniref:NACHT domain-containing protein n=1 Tax=unclassified Streptomyces TaxID=2593676 RepID=UPI00344A3D2F